METLLVQILTKLKRHAKLYPELETLARSSSKTHTESSYTFRCMCWPGSCCSDTKHADGTFPGSKLPRCFVCPYGIILKCFSVKCNCGYHCPCNVTFQSHCWWENSWWPELSSYLLLNWDDMSISQDQNRNLAFCIWWSQLTKVCYTTYYLFTHKSLLWKDESWGTCKPLLARHQGMSLFSALPFDPNKIMTMRSPHQASKRCESSLFPSPCQIFPISSTMLTRRQIHPRVMLVPCHALLGLHCWVLSRVKPVAYRVHWYMFIYRAEVFISQKQPTRKPFLPLSVPSSLQ